MDNPHQAARIFKVLSIDTRLRIIELLKQNSLCVNAISKAINITPAAVSQHLRVLRDADVVIADKQGYFMHYQINKETLKKWHLVAKKILQTN